MKSTTAPSAPASAIPSSSRSTASVTAGSSAAIRRGVKTAAIGVRIRVWRGWLLSSIERASRSIEPVPVRSSRSGPTSPLLAPNAVVRSTWLTARWLLTRNVLGPTGTTGPSACART